MRGAAQPVGGKVDWARYLDSNSDGRVVSRRLGSVLPERTDFIPVFSSAVRHAPRRLHTRGNILPTLSLYSH